MGKIIAFIATVAGAVIAFVLGRKTGSGDNDRQRDIRRAFSNLRETERRLEELGIDASRAAESVSSINHELGEAERIADRGTESAERADELIRELRRRVGEESNDS